MSGLRRAVGLGLVCAGLCLTTAASCVRENRLTHPDESDVVRLTQMQNDPWLAPDDVQLTSKSAPSGIGPLQRATVQRGYVTSVVPADAALAEVGAAQQAGWQVTGATCLPASPDPYGATDSDPGGVVVSLLKGQGADRAMTAWVQVNLDREDPERRAADGEGVRRRMPPDAGPGVPLGDPTPSPERPSWVAVVGMAPHHVDQWWPEPRTVAVEDTCLGGGSPGVAAQPDPGEEPLVREGERLPRPAARPWASGLPPEIGRAS
ncbi:MAG: hypothetical protein FWH11_15350, partial [Micrococcales bacterium]|nr:hypothetical protein [Micrococcales bacterium]